MKGNIAFINYYKILSHIKLRSIINFVHSSHPVESKELIKANLKEKNDLSTKSSFKSSCEENKEKYHQLAKSSPISKENLRYNI